MATTVDELITTYTVKDLYSAGVHKMADATERFGGAAARIGNQILGSLLNPINMLAGVVGGAGLLGLIKYAADTSMEFDTLTRSMAAVTGSFERARQVMSFVENLAIPSVFETEPLAQAATTLEAFGLAAERWLPVAEKMGSIFRRSANDTERLREFVDLLGRAKGGNTGEVFGPEGLGRFGMGRDVFAQMGLQFDKGGQFRGSVDQALSAIEQLVNQRFGRLGDFMAQGPAAKWASAMDAFRQAARQAGDVINAALLPVVSKMTDVLGNITRNGLLTKVTEGFAKLFNTDAIGSLLVKGVALLLTTLEQLPKIIRGVVDAFSKNWATVTTGLKVAAVLMAIMISASIISGFVNLITAVLRLSKVMAELGVFEMVVATISAALSGNLMALAGVAAAVAISIVGLYAAFKYFQSGIDSIRNMGQGLNLGDFGAEYNRILGQLNAPAGGAAGGPDLSPDAVNSSATGPLQQIATNTRKTAENTKQAVDLRRYALGGGDLAAMGVTPVEFARFGRGPKTTVVRLEGTTPLERWFAEEYNKHRLAELRQYGS